MSDDASLPKATVLRVVKELLPDGFRCTQDAKDLIVDCCVEFITLITSEAGELADKAKTNTLTPQHLIEALKELGFEQYIAAVTASASQAKEAKSNKLATKKQRKQTPSDMTEDEMAAEQAALFAAAAAACESET
eukprot:TRINITY_DN4754_c0_g1_i1.p2 TRINITY_DN4754_c0_g1~~TRINITY_DN4754_c0_g1_i1.p2  ORF type:complete len:149 (+),score=40.84 TRINITY_DN4754_c0_g1_i1:45-449(+)